MIAVVDYGVNNVKSVVRALAAGGHVGVLTTDPNAVRKAERLVVPGVGNFGQAARNMEQSGLGAAIREVADAGRPVAGICLGMQLFFRHSEEAPEAVGLGLFPGRVRKFRTALPIPHVGWAEVKATQSGARHPVLAGVFQSGPQFFYHVHSFHPTELPESALLATGDYDGPFPTIIAHDNILGVQFHPEKSQRAGIELLAAFVAWRP